MRKGTDSGEDGGISTVVDYVTRARAGIVKPREKLRRPTEVNERGGDEPLGSDRRV